MKKIRTVLALMAVAACPAFADSTAPSIEIQSDGAVAYIPLTLEGDGTWGLAAGTSFSLSNGSSGTFTNLTLDSDPKVSYGFGVTNDTSSTETFTFSFPTTPMPVTLPPGQYSVSTSFSGSLTNGDADDGVTLAPTSSAVQQAFINSTDITSVDLVNSPITIGNDPDSQPFGPYSKSDVITLTSPGTTINLETSFSLTAGDSASFSGSFTVTPIPEPSSRSFILLGMGALASLLGLRRLRRA